MAANLLPRGFRKRVARQKALDELAAERQLAQLRDQSMTSNTLSQIGAVAGLAKDAYGLADKVVPLFGRKGDSSKQTTLTDDFDEAIYEADRGKPGPARGRFEPLADQFSAAGANGPANPNPPPASDNRAETPQPLSARAAPTPERMGMAALERSGRAGQEFDWNVPAYPMKGTMDTAMREAADVGGFDFDMGGAAGPRSDDYDAAEARDRATMKLAGGQPVMPGPLSGLRFPSQARYEDGMRAVHAQMAEAERGLEGKVSDAEAARRLGDENTIDPRVTEKFAKQRSGPLRSGLGAQSAPEAGGNTFSMPRGGGRPMPSPQAAQAEPMANAQNDAGIATQSGQPRSLAAFAPDRDQLAGLMKSADGDRFSTFTQTAAALQDAAQRGDRARVKALLEASRHSRLSDVGPSTLFEMATGAHLDKARRALLKYGEIDPMLESNKARAAASAHSSQTRGDLNLFQAERGRAMLPDDLRANSASADIKVSDASVRPDLNKHKVLQAQTETRFRPSLHRSTLATQAEGRADSRNRRSWRNAEKPRAILRADETNFETALSQANARGEQPNPYIKTQDGRIVRMTTDQMRDFYARTGYLPGLHELQGISAAGVQIDPEPPRPGAGPGRSVSSADTTARERRAATESERKRLATTKAAAARPPAPVIDRTTIAKRRIDTDFNKKLVGGEVRFDGLSGRAAEKQEQMNGLVFDEMVNDLMRAGVPQREAEAHVTNLFQSKRPKAR